jgi:hypothetical protein
MDYGQSRPVNFATEISKTATRTCYLTLTPNNNVLCASNFEITQLTISASFSSFTPKTDGKRNTKPSPAQPASHNGRAKKKKLD